MKKKFLCVLLAAMVALSTVCLMGVANAEPEIKINWISQTGDIEIYAYNRDLGWASIRVPISSMGEGYYNELVIDVTTGKTVEEYVYCGETHEGLAIVKKSDENGSDKAGFIDTKGEVVIPLEFDSVGGFIDGLARVSKRDENGEKYGFINKDGEQVIPFEYEHADYFSEERACVGKRDENGELKYGYIDTAGSLIIPCEFDSGFDFSEGFAVVGKKDSDGDIKRGYIDKEGRLITPLEFDLPHVFHNGIAVVRKKDLHDYSWWGAIDTTGKLVIPFEYSNIENFKNSYEYYDTLDSKYFVANYYVNDSGDEYDFDDPQRQNDQDNTIKYTYVDKSGKRFLDGKYSSITPFRNGIAVVQDAETGKYGYINDSGDTVIPFEYDSAYAFSEGLAAVRKDGKFGFIDIDGKMVIPFEFDQTMGFYCGTAMIAESDREGGLLCGLINKEGKEILPMEYDMIQVGEDLGVVKKGENWGFFANPYWKTKQADKLTISLQQIIIAGAVIFVFIILAIVFAINHRKRTRSSVVEEKIVSSEVASPSAQPLERCSFCPSCGTKLPENSKFCPNCGRKM